MKRFRIGPAREAASRTRCNRGKTNKKKRFQWGNRADGVCYQIKAHQPPSRMVQGLHRSPNVLPSRRGETVRRSWWERETAKGSCRPSERNESGHSAIPRNKKIPVRGGKLLGRSQSVELSGVTGNTTGKKLCF